MGSDLVHIKESSTNSKEKNWQTKTQGFFFGPGEPESIRTSVTVTVAVIITVAVVVVVVGITAVVVPTFLCGAAYVI